MKVEVVTPEDFRGGVIGDLNSRRGQVQGTDSRGNAQVVTAMVPLANMFGYINTLRSMSQGRAQYSMQFDHYEQVPQAIAGRSQSQIRVIRPRAAKAKENSSSGEQQWVKRSLSVTSRTAILGRLAMLIMARRRWTAAITKVLAGNGRCDVHGL